MNSNIYDRKKHSYKNRPYYCPIHNRWFYPYMYMNPYMPYMMNPYMSYMMNPYMNACMAPSYYYGNMHSCNNMNKYETMRGYKQDAHKVEKIPQYEEGLYVNRKKEENKKKYYEEDSLDDIVIVDENEHIKKEENLDYKQKKTSDSDLKVKPKEKKDIQLEEVNKEEEPNELYRKAKINMRKVPLKEIID